MQAGLTQASLYNALLFRVFFFSLNFTCLLTLFTLPIQRAIGTERYNSIYDNRVCRGCVRECGCISANSTELLRREFWGKTVVFVGDSTTRISLMSLYNILQPTTLPTRPLQYITNSRKVISRSHDQAFNLIIKLHSKNRIKVFGQDKFELSDFYLRAEDTQTDLYFFWAGTAPYLSSRSAEMAARLTNTDTVKVNAQERPIRPSHIFVNVGLWDLAGPPQGEYLKRRYNKTIVVGNYSTGNFSQSLAQGLLEMCKTLGCRTSSGREGGAAGARVFWRDVNYLVNHTHNKADTFCDTEVQKMQNLVLQPRVSLQGENEANSCGDIEAIPMALKTHVLTDAEINGSATHAIAGSTYKGEGTMNAGSGASPSSYEFTILPAHEYSAQRCCKYVDDVHFGLLCGMQLWHIWCLNGLCTPAV